MMDRLLLDERNRNRMSEMIILITERPRLMVTMIHSPSLELKSKFAQQRLTAFFLMKEIVTALVKLAVMTTMKRKLLIMSTWIKVCIRTKNFFTSIQALNFLSKALINLRPSKRSYNRK